MLSAKDFEELIIMKRRRSHYNLAQLLGDNHNYSTTSVVNDKKTKRAECKSKKEVVAIGFKPLASDNASNKENIEERGNTSSQPEEIPPVLERHMRRNLGLPIMLKTGEYSPNNPLTRDRRCSGDVLYGLGEYERRSHRLRRREQQEYREHLDQQLRKNQEEKEKLELERLSKQRKIRDERNWQIETERLELEKSVEQGQATACAPLSTAKVDTGVQVNGAGMSSVGVQTDDELFQLPTQYNFNEAERELSPPTVEDMTDKQICNLHAPATWVKDHKWIEEGWKNFDPTVKNMRNGHMSILDVDAIQMRNMQVEEDIAVRQQFYQKELKEQILEQQRIRNERKERERMLEQAEMRRLEHHLTRLGTAKAETLAKHLDITKAMNENADAYETKRTQRQKEIDIENQSVKAAKAITNMSAHTSKSDGQNEFKPPLYYPDLLNRKYKSSAQAAQYSTDGGVKSLYQNYDVDSSLRRNLNPSKESLFSNCIDNNTNFKQNALNIEDIGNTNNNVSDRECKNKLIVEKALIHERPKNVSKMDIYEPSFLNREKINYARQDREVLDVESLPVSVLRERHNNNAVATTEVENDDTDVSEAMKLVEQKWKVPVVEKNIVKTMPSEREVDNLNILTQLGTMRRQLQLEHLMLNKTFSNNDL